MLLVDLVWVGTLPKWGHPQSFLKMPHDERLAAVIRITRYLTFFIIFCPVNYHYSQNSHTGACCIGKQVGPFAASPGKYGQL